MKQVSLYFIFLLFMFQTFAQSSINNKGKTGELSENERWDLDNFVWSHNQGRSSDKPLLDFNAIENWASVGNDEDLSISLDGKYVAYSIQRYRKRDSIIVQSLLGSWRQAFADVSPGFFSRDSKLYIFPDKGGLCFLEIGKEERHYIHNVLSYKTPLNKNNEWVAYQLKDNENTVVLRNLLTDTEKRFTGVASYDFNGNKEWLVCQLNDPTKGVVIYHLTTKKEMQFPSAVRCFFDPTLGKALLILTSGKANGDSIGTLKYIDLQDGLSKIIWSAYNKSNIVDYNIDYLNRQVVFMIQSIPDNPESMPENSIWYWRLGMNNSVRKVNNQTDGVDGLVIKSPLYFSKNGQNIIFSLGTKSNYPEPMSDAVKIDVWSYKDATLQSAQATELIYKPKQFDAMINKEGSRVLSLCGYYYAGDAGHDFAIIAKDNNKIIGDRFWEKDDSQDSTWLLSLKDGSQKFIGNSSHGNYRYYSPDGKYLLIIDGKNHFKIYSYNLTTGKEAKIYNGIPEGHLSTQEYYKLHNLKPNVGVAAWVEHTGVLVYDNYDIWLLDLEGNMPPSNVTNGYGRQQRITFSLAGKNQYSWILPIIKAKESLLLKAVNKTSKYSGFYKKVLGKTGDPEKLFMGPYMVDVLRCSQDGKPYMIEGNNVSIVKRQSPTEAPNYFVTTDYKTYQPITNLRVQQHYNWLTAELHSFKQMDGSKSQGILYKPQNFDPSKKYPVIISFYGTLTDKIFQLPTPQYLDAPEIFTNPSWFVSHGYLVFLPDVYFFPNGNWGPSCINTLDGAARYLRNLPFIDGAHLAVSGHSNSGRFGYYVLTHSRSFAAMSIGSGLTNVISRALSDDEGARAFGGTLRIAEILAYGGGMGSLWENKDTWLDQTSVLHADKVSCPVLMFHNKKDGAFNAGMASEMFIALRRLGKKAWWLQYDEGRHRLGMPRDLKDYTIRYTQFFDHYLKEAPAPRWMTNGIPNALKGIEARYELDPAGTCALDDKNDCKICKKWNEQYKKHPEMFTKPISEWKLDKDIEDGTWGKQLNKKGSQQTQKTHDKQN